LRKIEKIIGNLITGRKLNSANLFQRAERSNARDDFHKKNGNSENNENGARKDYEKKNRSGGKWGGNNFSSKEKERKGWTYEKTGHFRLECSEEKRNAVQLSSTE